jgi:hypothetical protein
MTEYMNAFTEFQQKRSSEIVSENFFFVSIVMDIGIFLVDELIMEKIFMRLSKEKS